jgi:hypothetical protein
MACSDNPKRKVFETISMVNPCKDSLDDLTLLRVDYLRRGYDSGIEHEWMSKNVEVVKLVVYEK